MLNDRKKAFDIIANTLALTALDIQYHQAINDQSLNIHAEEYFKNVFNFVYNGHYVNANQEQNNAAFIDLVDHQSKRIVQITTSRDKEKILNTLQILQDPQYADYQLNIYYLMGKAKPAKATTEQVRKQFNVNLHDVLKDSSDLIRDINALNDNKLIELAERYFKVKREKYTDHMALNLIFSHLIERHGVRVINYDSDFSSIELDDKLVLNKINRKISGKISDGLEYATTIATIDNGEISEQLHQLIIQQTYRDLLIELLQSKRRKSTLVTLGVERLHSVAIEVELDFNTVIGALYHRIESMTLIKDFNNTTVIWILIAYFFELCDIGIKTS